MRFKEEPQSVNTQLELSTLAQLQGFTTILEVTTTLPLLGQVHFNKLEFCFLERCVYR